MKPTWARCPCSMVAFAAVNTAGVHCCTWSETASSPRTGSATMSCGSSSAPSLSWVTAEQKQNDMH